MTEYLSNWYNIVLSPLSLQLAFVIDYGIALGQFSHLVEEYNRNMMACHFSPCFSLW